jgi:predicted glycosyltransferase involved in capsule biosynthesis
MPCSKRIKLHNESNEIKNLIVDVKSKTKIAIIVPYRDLHKEQQRAKQLEIFVNEMQSFLEPDVYKIFIVEQSNDERKFNRGKLLNIGFKLANDLDYNVFIFHDVDLIPSIELQSHYKEPVSQNPVHIASVWNRYNKNEKYFGGVVSFSKELFSKINGFPNNFWGWGGEDDELFARIEKVLYFFHVFI